ncbi:MAG: hypothetical protein APR63_12350 [Desulfuromonas sp. SDB]|nr:MAG: hypothetical protein APR63_12350 [Desulfuromonas sp. SDB]
MILKQLREIKIFRGVKIFTVGEFERSFETEDEIRNLLKDKKIRSENSIISRFIPPEAERKLSSEFIIDNKKYTGLLAIKMNYVATAVDFLWENAMTSEGFESVVKNYRKRKRIKNVISKTEFHNKLISELVKHYPRNRGRIRIKEDIFSIILYNNKADLHSLIEGIIDCNPRTDRRNCFNCIARTRINQDLIIHDYIFASEDFNEYSYRKLKPSRRKSKLAAVFDGKMVKLNDEIILEFSRDGFIRTMCLTDEDLRSLLIKTKYLVKNDSTDRKQDFRENVYYVSCDPQIIFYDELEVVGTKNNDINLMSRIDDFIYHPRNSLKPDLNNFNFLALGVVDDFFNKI